MTMATCRPPGPAWAPRRAEGVSWAAIWRGAILWRERRVRLGGLDVHDLLFLGFQGFVHALDCLIRQLLDLGLHALFLVLVDDVGLLGGAQVVVGVAAHVAHRHPLLLRVLV